MTEENLSFTPSKECNICGSEYDAECGGVQGHFGVTPVTFCEWCYSSVIDMASQHLGLDEMDEDDSEDMKTILDTVGIDYDKVITQYKKKQRFFSVMIDEPCGMSHK